MIEFKYESSGHPDYSKVIIKLDGEYSVRQLIAELLAARPKSKGVIEVNGLHISYDNATITNISSLSKVEDLIVKEVRGMTCYGNYDFTITASQNTNKEGDNQFVNVECMLKELQSDMYEILRKYEKKTHLSIRSIKVDKCGSIRISSDIDFEQLVFDIEV